MFEKKNLLKASAAEREIKVSAAYQVWRNTTLLGMELVLLPVFLAGLLYIGGGLIANSFPMVISGCVWCIACLFCRYVAYPANYLELRKKMWGIREEVE
jgi:hypothetical protein